LGDFHFQSSLSYYLTEEAFSPIYLSTKQEHYEDYHSVIKKIFHESEGKDKDYRTIIKLEIIRFFALLNRYDTDIQNDPMPKKNDRTRVIIKVLDYISNHYSEKISIKAMSRYLNMSEQHFCRVFKAYTGKTLVEYVTLFRLDKAYRLIVSTDIPITQIPELTGFCNENYFSRIFKKQYTFSPSHLRRAGKRPMLDDLELLPSSTLKPGNIDDRSNSPVDSHGKPNSDDTQLKDHSKKIGEGDPK
jgi:AraC-like DNA-binding protein